MRDFICSIAGCIAFGLAAPVVAQNIDQAPKPTFETVARMDLPVFEGDITDRPYRVLGQVRASKTKFTAFSKEPSTMDLKVKLWDKARDLGADAVLNAEFPPSEKGGIAYGRRQAWGDAVKFLSEEEATEWRSRNQ